MIGEILAISSFLLFSDLVDLLVRLVDLYELFSSSFMEEFYSEVYVFASFLFYCEVFCSWTLSLESELEESEDSSSLSGDYGVGSSS